MMPPLYEMVIKPKVKRFECYTSCAAFPVFFSCYGDIWMAQSFTPQVNHTLKHVKLRAIRHDTPGTLTFSVRLADAEHLPIGGDLSTGIYDGDSLPEGLWDDAVWFEVPMSPLALVAETEYVIVMGAPDAAGSATFDATGCSTPGGYARGINSDSDDGGSNWYANPTADVFFEEWGIP